MTAALKAVCGTPFGGLFAFTGMDRTVKRENYLLLIRFRALPEVKMSLSLALAMRLRSFQVPSFYRGGGGNPGPR